ncbi:MAG: malate dehydrogenase (quinone) [Labilithrix sp.]|nr:malate dehydrogenase (quinone) [Labilithrix sp.]MCW5813143.1 malate dehydrogenase (quinone) [Labilithrix sp.]
MSQGESVDVALIGAGIMSATLGTLLLELDPSLRVGIYERLDRAAAESSDAWNNAGTGHAGYCELNYTPRRPDGTVDCAKALLIASQFALSLELWDSLVKRGDLPDLTRFLRSVPHMSFVWGEGDVAFLRARHAQLRETKLFAGIELTEDRNLLAAWLPLVMEGRARDVPVAATRVLHGTDVNFGELTRALIANLSARSDVELHLSHEVRGLRRDGKTWCVDVHDLATGAERTVRAKFVFIGAGGYSLSLLEQSGIPEAAGYGAFPVSGQWLKCTNRAVVARHHAKVYGCAEVGAPPMSVPHLDSRWIGGEQELLFGPYAGFTTKFLKQGSWLDLLRSVGVHNVGAVMSAGLENLDLTRYLVGQAMLSVEERMALLRRYYPAAADDDWELQIAGLRVQIIKATGDGRGELKFGTEVVTAADGSIAALLGASPGASTAVAIMLDLLARCFPDRWRSEAWRTRLAAVLPSRVT